MFLVKLGMLSCAFYAGLILAAAAGHQLIMRTRGMMYFIPKDKSLFWVFGLQFGALLWILWIISFGAAWLILYPDLKSSLPAII